ncbi:MAG: tetratricopeptide repeat protein [Spirochaetaceae bacterium]|jgi:tetratricopeptide (TPR) repeat protein|nr:tetratricopeptide repeat protein [Spirochaetaceae bacterium]
MKRHPLLHRFISLLVPVVCWFSSCVSRTEISAEEYFSMGMAYLEMGKYEEAEKWLNRAHAVDKTKAASEYNLGRIAFEMGRYEDAVRLFDRILEKDPENILALKAAAYTRIKTGELEKAEALYNRVLALVPESADDGYNHALVLFAMEKYEQAEAVLLKYPFTLEDNTDAFLLLARSQKTLNKPEAVDTYDKWLQRNSDNQVRYEYAQVLEQGEFYAKALEEYRELLNALPAASQDGALQKLSKPSVRFALGRLLLIADSENEDGINELTLAVTDGFSDAEALEKLLEDARVSDARKDEIRRLIHNITVAKEKVETPAAGDADTGTEAGSGEAPKDGAGSETGSSDGR